jgi:hypothetical protein
MLLLLQVHRLLKNHLRFHKALYFIPEYQFALSPLALNVILQVLPEYHLHLNSQNQKAHQLSPLLLLTIAKDHSTC